MRRRPISTATRATAIVDSSSKTSADRNAIRRVPSWRAGVAADPADDRGLGFGAPARRVGSPSTTSRSGRPRLRSATGAGCGLRASRPAAKIGMRGRVRAMTSAEIQSAWATTTRTARGTRTASTSWEGTGRSSRPVHRGHGGECGQFPAPRWSLAAGGPLAPDNQIGPGAGLRGGSESRGRDAGDVGDEASAELDLARRRVQGGARCRRDRACPGRSRDGSDRPGQSVSPRPRPRRR